MSQFLLLITVLLLVDRYEATQSNLDSLSNLSSFQEYVDCEVRTVVVRGSEQTHSVQHRCVTYSDEETDGAEDMVYDLPDWLLEKYADHFESQPTSYLRIHGGRISRTSTEIITGGNVRTSSSSPLQGDIIVASQNSMVEVSDVPLRWPNHRKLAPSTGASSVLLVRVTTNDASVSLSANTMSDRFFGSSGTAQSTMSQCSFGRLNFAAASGPEVVNGVIELPVNVAIQGQNIGSLENTFSTELTNKIGSINHLQHVIFCVPNGSVQESGSSKWLAYAYVGSSRSFFNEKQCGYLSILVHELGHNMGLGHSGEDGIAYGDQSGIMGFGYSQVNKPIMCFNAAKNWQLGWYSDKSTEVSVAEGAWRGRLYGYSDYSNSPGHVLLKVGDLFLQYNKITNLNKDTKERRNQVAITRSPIGLNAKSEALAGIDVRNAIHTIENYSNGKALLIEVCDMVQLANGLSYFDLSLRLSNQVTRCGLPERPPALMVSPTRTPTPAPVLSPTLNPTPAPIPHPTNQPTPYPTRRPTRAPVDTTAAPSSSEPTRSPTDRPTLVPSTTPTFVYHSSDPSNSPSASIAPSVPPSAFPTALASAMPSSSIAPTSYPSSDLTCDDHKDAMFPVDKTIGLYQSCIWLAARPEWQEKLCVETHSAYKICEETCGSCTDSCKDTDGTFEHHGLDRPCSWLSLRWFVQKTVCVPGHQAMDVCKETCDVCDVSEKDRSR